jgi:AraC-like DNA-binding protein
VEVNDEQLSNLLAATIAWMTDCPNNNTQQSGDKHTNRARIHIIKLVQEYIVAHYNEAICMEDLCRVTGVGLRTLQRYFKEYFDLSIAEYIKTTRLNNAHRELAKAHSSERTVTYIALQNGFNHLGRFSVEFHQRFGQSPRDALAMQAGHKT